MAYDIEKEYLEQEIKLQDLDLPQPERGGFQVMGTLGTFHGVKDFWVDMRKYRVPSLSIVVGSACKFNTTIGRPQGRGCRDPHL